ncbi:MAG: adenylate kinase [Firmicutes bacterium]|jgi:adenylate kinase|nr:adenylate kinase [Bacillota bacterium]
MRLVLMGPPGVGKGTQAVRLSRRFSVPHISTGDIFREGLAKNIFSDLSVKEHVYSGRLVPDDITVGIIRNRLMDSDCAKGFILDGFPRNLIQAKALEEILEDLRVCLDDVLYINAEFDILVKRISGRRICQKCGAIYHMLTNPPPQDCICPQCGGNIYQRIDDREDTVRKRLKVYEKLTKPVIDYYRDLGILKTVDGGVEADKTLDAIISII